MLWGARTDRPVVGRHEHALLDRHRRAGRREAVHSRRDHPEDAPLPAVRLVQQHRAAPR